MSNENFAELTDNYILKSIVYVNSAEYGYAEIELDDHIALYGNNNSGKTGTLAGTKILLFPETSFTSCKKKFMFVSKNGEYFDTEDSYEHYFPDSRSFIIMEIENPHGRFSMVCYRTNNYAYARFFIPVAYSEIRELFSIGDDGELNPDLSVSNVAEKCKELGGLRVSDAKELADLMFGSRLAAPDKSRFCVLPLRDSKKGTVNAFRNIYQLAFDNGSSASDTLPTILATLVEMKRGRDKEKLDANLPALIEARNRLAEESEWVQSLENSKPIFDGVWEQFEQTKQSLTNYAQQYSAISDAIIEFKKNIIPEINHLTIEQEALKLIYLDRKSQLKQSEELLRDLKAELKANKKQLQKDEIDLDDAKKCREFYRNPSDSEVVIDLTERLEEAKTELRLYEEEGGVSIKLQDLIKDQNKLKSKRTGLENTLRETGKLLFSQLQDSHATTILNSINPLFSSATYNLRPEQKDVVFQFTSLFGFDSTGLLTLNGSVIHPDLNRIVFNMQMQSEIWNQDLKNTIEQLDGLKEKIESLSKLVTNDDIEGLIEDYKIQVNDIETKLRKINSIASLDKRVSESKDEVGQMDVQEQSLADEVEGELKDNVGHAYDNLSRVETELLKFYQQKKDMQEIEDDLTLAKSNYDPEYSQSITKIELLTREHGRSIYQLSSDVSKQFSELVNRYHMLSNRVNHPDIDRHLNLNGMADYERNIRIFFNAFETLEHEKRKLNDAIEGHNGVLNSQLNELKEARETVRREVSSIDESLNTSSVSNLSEIILEVEFEPTFLSIMNTLDKHEIEGNSLLDEEFYSTLSKLVINKYYDKSTGRIKLRDIIKSVNYSFTKKVSGKSEKKGQSGGTTTTITAFILSVLLGRISDSYTKLRMPIIVDEIGTLDNHNKKATIEQISSQGFSLFCATPTFLAAVNRYVGRYVYINRENLTTPMVESCHMKCIPKFVNKFGEKQA